jgi:tetratricopeptide (TPR) repeat protein
MVTSDSGDRRLRAWEIGVLAVILAFGVAVRAGYLAEARQAPDFASPAVDAGFHDWWARGLAFDRWTPPSGEADPQIGTTAYFRPPGYPYFLAAVYRLFGEGYVAPRIVQMALGLGNALLAFWIGRRWFGRAPGLVLAAGMCGYWIFTYYEAEFHDPVLFITLLLTSVLLLGLWRDRGSVGFAAGAGLSGGLAAVVRPNAIAVLALAVLWIVWAGWRGAKPQPWRTSALTLLVAATLAILPVTLRNWLVARDLVLLTTNGGVNLYIGNHPGADGFVTTEIPGLGRFRTCFDWPGVVAGVEREVGHPLKHSEVSRYFAAQARGFIAEHPGEFLRLTAKKALLFWGPVEVAHNKEVHYERVESPLLSRLPGSFPLVLALAVLGIAVLAFERRSTGPSPRWDMTLLVAGAVLAYFLSVLPIFAAARYRVPVIPFLLLFAAYGVVRFVAFSRERWWKHAVLCLALFVPSFALASHAFAGYTPSLARWHFDRGADWGRIGDADRAIASYRSALAVDPTMFEANYNLGHVLFDRGDVLSAIEHWERARTVDPSFAPVWFNLSLAYEKAGQREQAIERLSEAVRLDPSATRYHARLADALFAAGELARARDEYEAVLTASPDDRTALRNLAWILATTGQDAHRAVALAEQAARLTDGRSPSVLDVLAAAYHAAGRRDDAVATARRAVAVARAMGSENLARQIESRLPSYEGGVRSRH